MWTPSKGQNQVHTHRERRDKLFVFWYLNISLNDLLVPSTHYLNYLLPVEWGEYPHLFLLFKALSKSVDKVGYYTLTSENAFALLCFKKHNDTSAHNIHILALICQDSWVSLCRLSHTCTSSIHCQQFTIKAGLAQLALVFPPNVKDESSGYLCQSEAQSKSSHSPIFTEQIDVKTKASSSTT